MEIFGISSDHYTTLNILKTTKLYTLSKCILLYKLELNEAVPQKN